MSRCCLCFMVMQMGREQARMQQSVSMLRPSGALLLPRTCSGCQCQRWTSAWGMMPAGL